MQNRFIAGLAAFALFCALTLAAADDSPHPAARAVLTFNQAITDRDMDTAMGLLADGGVQFHLHPAHPGMPEDHPLTEDMAIAGGGHRQGTTVGIQGDGGSSV